MAVSHLSLFQNQATYTSLKSWKVQSKIWIQSEFHMDSKKVCDFATVSSKRQILCTLLNYVIWNFIAHKAFPHLENITRVHMHNNNLLLQIWVYITACETRERPEKLGKETRTRTNTRHCVIAYIPWEKIQSRWWLKTWLLHHSQSNYMELLSLFFTKSIQEL